MIAHPNFDPVAFRVLDWPVHWYGIMWLCAFLAAGFAAKRLAAKPAFAGAPVPAEELLTAGIIGALLGGRLGYALFYDFAVYAAEPLRVLQIWRGGMSFHGGLLGVAAALFWLARKNRLPFLRITDFAAALAPPGLGMGRIGNFINGELPGRAASPDLPWAMIFPGDDIARHPSPLYQAFLEGVALGALMWMMASRKPRSPGFLSAVFLLGYAACRLFSELFRQPDPHLGLLAGGFSMGQWLSLPMFLLGAGLLLREKLRRK
ncbi:MAG: prolipoprotein diacylglyceryl transferase [Gammaproteobacteria bacterium]